MTDEVIVGTGDDGAKRDREGGLTRQPVQRAGQPTEPEPASHIRRVLEVPVGHPHLRSLIDRAQDSAQRLSRTTWGGEHAQTTLQLLAQRWAAGTQHHRVHVHEGGVRVLVEASPHLYVGRTGTQAQLHVLQQGHRLRFQIPVHQAVSRQALGAGHGTTGGVCRTKVQSVALFVGAVAVAVVDGELLSVRILVGLLLVLAVQVGTIIAEHKLVRC
mmetsp:Transcript_15083/g.45182  ORF Transcript_15083/g.45182 Transcript_15083/m.45182 type:complete len:215 (+) Transcript_15083:90-734(+)